MKTQQLIYMHEKCIAILEAVSNYEHKIKDRLFEIQFGYACQEFPKIKADYEHDIVIYKMCIDRLMERYENQLKN